MHITLAPMEGVVDAPMRRVQAAIGGPDAMVTEFVRVTEHLLPAKVFHRLVPELNHPFCGYGEVPLTVQLLGSNPEMLGVNAVRAIELGAPAIDLNFGCPAKTVNKSMGGAIMLRNPQSVFDAVKGVRSAVDPQYSVSGKMRLGYEDKTLALENAKAIEEGGAAYLTVHARTKVEGYKPPAYWEWIARIRESVSIPVVANGEIWTPEDYQRCKEVSGCDRIMIGRGLVANPFLVEQIRNPEASRDPAYNWQRLKPYLLGFFEDVSASIDERHVHGRIKQWLTMLGWHFPQAKELFQQLRTERELQGVARVLYAECTPVEEPPKSRQLPS